MTARPGMERIILEIRAHTDTHENEVEVNGVIYWTDDQIQQVLDNHRKDVRGLQLTAFSEYENGSTVYKRYYFPNELGRWVERDDTPDTFSVVDGVGVAAPEHTIDYDGRLVIFSNTTLGREYFIRARVFDTSSAIADIWLMKAGQRAELINWRAGGQNLQEDEEYQHCMEQYRLYSGLLGIHSIRLKRIGYYYG